MAWTAAGAFGFVVGWLTVLTAKYANNGLAPVLKFAAFGAANWIGCCALSWFYLDMTGLCVALIGLSTGLAASIGIRPHIAW
jgi:hypothetical protein